MEFGEKEKVIILAALHNYMETIEKILSDETLNEDDNAELVNDASLLEIIISRFDDSSSS